MRMEATQGSSFPGPRMADIFSCVGSGGGGGVSAYFYRPVTRNKWHRVIGFMADWLEKFGKER
jgi:hypothetical protein